MFLVGGIDCSLWVFAGRGPCATVFGEMQVFQADGTGYCGQVAAAASRVAFPNALQGISKERWATESMCCGRGETVSSVVGRVCAGLKKCVRFASMHSHHARKAECTALPK